MRITSTSGGCGRYLHKYLSDGDWAVIRKKGGDYQKIKVGVTPYGRHDEIIENIEYEAESSTKIHEKIGEFCKTYVKGKLVSYYKYNPRTNQAHKGIGWSKNRELFSDGSEFYKKYLNQEKVTLYFDFKNGSRINSYWAKWNNGNLVFKVDKENEIIFYYPNKRIMGKVLTNDIFNTYRWKLGLSQKDIGYFIFKSSNEEFQTWYNPDGKKIIEGLVTNYEWAGVKNGKWLIEDKESWFYNGTEVTEDVYYNIEVIKKLHGEEGLKDYLEKSK